MFGFAGVQTPVGRGGGLPLGRRVLAEFLGTALLVTVVVGSGIAAQQLSPADVGLQFFENTTATVFGLAVIILVFGPISGAHLNPVVSLADWLEGRRRGGGLNGVELTGYLGGQVLGGVAGAMLANSMFDQAPWQISTRDRVTGGHLIGEMVATAGLIAVVSGLAGRNRSLVAATVAAYIGSACWFTSSGSFANPAATVGRMFSDSFAGIAPVSGLGFIAAQLLGASLGAAVMTLLRPDRP